MGNPRWRYIPGNGGSPFGPDYFRDVFGGPPRTVFSRHLDCSNVFFYEDIFRQRENSPAYGGDGRSLPKFTIPSKDENDDFYDDIFGWENERNRSRSRELRPSEEFDDDYDDDVSRFHYNLRPINVKSDRIFAGKQPIPFGFPQNNASPETISLEPTSNCSLLRRVSADDFKANSPAAPSVSSAPKFRQTFRDDDEDEDEDDDDETAMSPSYVIEINSNTPPATACYRYGGGGSEPNCIDEAIAWAKGKFQMDGPVKKFSEIAASSDDQEEQGAPAEEEEQTAENETLGQRETRKLDEKISKWSAGKETDIRLLLSTLHHILWPNSGWLAIPLSNLIEMAKVKKAYQRARLCLHPDKLQQRGATPPQKYLAEKAFSILQDAWSVFISMAIL